jgi:cell division protein FtsB
VAPYSLLATRYSPFATPPATGRDRPVKATLTRCRHFDAMVMRRRLRNFLNALALYTIAALLIGYFGVNAYTGEHGLIAKRDLDQDIAQLTLDLDAVKAERAVWQRRVSLLKSDNIDPDLLDERARRWLDDVDPRDLTLMLKPR